LGKTHKVDDQNMMVGELLNSNDLDCHQGMFKLTMKSNAIVCVALPFDLNPLTKMWCLVTTFQILSFNFPDYVKLAKLAMVQMVKNVENEKCFSTLAFMKSKLWNRFITHLPLVVYMFAQCNLQNFPYASVLNNGKELVINIVMMVSDAPPNSLMNSTLNPKVKTMEGKRIEMHSLIHNTLGVEGCVRALRWD